MANDGFTGLVQGIPPLSMMFGGLFKPALWETPVSDGVTFTIPADAQPGTYVAAIKAQREFGGEPLNRGDTADIQIGTPRATSLAFQTGNCQACHQGASGFDRVLHGIADRRACFACHPGLSFEPDDFMDIRVHTVHAARTAFPAMFTTAERAISRPPAVRRGAS